MGPAVRGLVTGLAALLPGVAPAQGADACALMSKDAFAAHVGRPAYVDPEAVALGTGLVCGYNGGQIILFSGEGAPGRTGRG